jgi:hypothetical protein
MYSKGGGCGIGGKIEVVDSPGVVNGHKRFSRRGQPVEKNKVAGYSNRIDDEVGPYAVTGQYSYAKTNV